jgi:hypothetical protein
MSWLRIPALLVENLVYLWQKFALKAFIGLFLSGACDAEDFYKYRLLFRQY